MFNKQKKYFNLKLVGVQKMIWDLEFKVFKTREIREEIRVEYDNLVSKIYSIDEQVKKEEEAPTMKEEDLGRLKDEKVRMEEKTKRFQEQMKALDLEINGSKPTVEYQDGVTGIRQQLDSLKELQIMIADYIKSL